MLGCLTTTEQHWLKNFRDPLVVCDDQGSSHHHELLLSIGPHWLPPAMAERTTGMCASAAHTLLMGFEPPLPPDDHVRLLVPRADKRWQTGSRLSFGALSLVLCAPDCCVGVATISPPSCRGWGTSRRASRAAFCCTLRAWAPPAKALQRCTSANTRAKSDSFLARALAFCCSALSQNDRCGHTNSLLPIPNCRLPGLSSRA